MNCCLSLWPMHLISSVSEKQKEMDTKEWYQLPNWSALLDRFLIQWNKSLFWNYRELNLNSTWKWVCKCEHWTLPYPKRHVCSVPGSLHIWFHVPMRQSPSLPLPTSATLQISAIRKKSVPWGNFLYHIVKVWFPLTHPLCHLIYLISTYHTSTELRHCWWQDITHVLSPGKKIWSQTIWQYSIGFRTFISLSLKVRHYSQ
jgi:hypothetical protein